MDHCSFVTFNFLSWLREEIVHSEDGLFVHFELDRGGSLGFVFSACVGCLSVDSTAIGKERLIVKVVVFAVRVPGLESSSVVEQALIVHHFLIGWLSLPKSNFFTDISLFFLDLFLLLSSNFLHTFFSFDFPHSMISELLSLLSFLILISFFLLNLLIFFSCFQSSFTKFFLFLQVLLVIDASLDFGSFLKLDL